MEVALPSTARYASAGTQPLFNQLVNVRNQFGTGVVTIMQPIGVCVPTKKLGYTLL